jgi:hypothetical protein
LTFLFPPFIPVIHELLPIIFSDESVLGTSLEKENIESPLDLINYGWRLHMDLWDDFSPLRDQTGCLLRLKRTSPDIHHRKGDKTGALHASLVVIIVIVRTKTTKE